MAKFSKQDKEEIIKLLKEGYKTSELAKRYGVTPAAIRYVKDEYFLKGDFSLKLTKDKYRDKNKTEQEKIKELETKIEELELVIEHQKKFQAFVDQVKKKKRQ